MNIANWLSSLQAYMRSSSDRKRISTARKLMRSARRLFLRASALHARAIRMAPEITDNPIEHPED